MRTIEKALTKLSSKDPIVVEDALITYLQAISLYMGLIDKVGKEYKKLDKLISLIFSNRNSKDQKKFISCCLLRLICHNGNIVWSKPSFRMNVFGLFDTTLKEVYRSLKIDPESPNHDKFPILIDTEKQVLDQFNNITNSMVSLRTVSAHREQYMKGLNIMPGKFFFDHFVDPSLISEERLNELFFVVRNYLSSSVKDKVNTFVNVRGQFKLYFSDVKKCKSLFCKVCILAPWKKVFDIIESDFNNIDAIKPANIKISGTDRKYPLHIPNKKIQWKFIIENKGPGYAFDVNLKILDQEGVTIPNSVINIGQLELEKSERYIDAIVESEAGNSFAIIGDVSWKNFDDSSGKTDFLLEISGQRTNLNWGKLKDLKPYSLEAVQTEEELVGRKEVIQRLYAKLSSEPLESSIIWGQKRVGKTSIANSLRTILEKRENYSIIYIAVGDLDKTSPEKFIQGLGTKVVNSILFSHPELGKIARPSFDAALSPLLEYFIRIKENNDDLRFVVIIDEFDEIPRDLYYYTPVGDTFFHNIRSISSESQIGFVFVGGENIQTIKQSTDRLNKFESFRVDYFDKEKHWRDFQELVRRPVKNQIEINERAILALYNLTEGNPFFTKFICGKIYLQVCSERNAFVAVREVDEANSELTRGLDIHNINHFWKDCIYEYDSTKRDMIETQRRKFMIGYAKISRQKGFVTKDDLTKSHYFENKFSVEKMVDSFVNRGVLLEDAGNYRFKPRFFDAWLIDTGLGLLSSEFLDEESIEIFREKEEELYVTDSEITNIVDDWGLYRGSKITPQHVRAWLNQFASNTESRLMFQLLQELRFYNESKIREKLSVIHTSVKRGIVEIVSRSKRVRKDFILSSFGAISKSSTSYARMYASENKITVNNIVSFHKIGKILEKRNDVQGIVFIDDIIGSGNTVIEHLEEIDCNYGDILADNNVKIVVAAICGLASNIAKIEKRGNRYKYQLEVMVPDLLTKEDQSFSDKSIIFKDEYERKEAEKISFKYGVQLYRKHPLGYDNCQLLVVFHDNCPDNSLPILWISGNSVLGWKPLFKRN